MNPAQINYAFFLSLAIIILGIILKKTNIITNKEGQILSRVILNVTLPAIILDTVPSIHIQPAFIVMPIIAIGYSFIVLGVGFLLFRKTPAHEKGLILMTIISFNVGNFAYPIIEAIYGVEGLQYAAMFDMGNAFIIFVVVYLVGGLYSPKLESPNDRELLQKDNSQGSTKQANLVTKPEREDGSLSKPSKLTRILQKVLRSIPLWSYVIGIVMNLTHLQWPALVGDAIHILARANMGLVLLSLGVLLEWNFPKAQWIMILKILIVRYSFGIIVGIILCLILPFAELMQTITFILLILPVGMSLIPFTVEFGYDERIMATVANLTIIISFPLIWIVLLLRI